MKGATSRAGSAHPSGAPDVSVIGVLNNRIYEYRMISLITGYNYLYL